MPNLWSHLMLEAPRGHILACDDHGDARLGTNSEEVLSAISLGWLNGEVFELFRARKAVNHEMLLVRG